jgi:hypothetical protein
MKALLTLASAGASLLIATTGIAQAADVTEEELLQRLEGVAPADVLGNATLLHVTEGGEMQTVREGTNGWTCMYPGTDPMCVDAGGLEWMHALMEGAKEAPQDLGFVYMLLGDEGTSNIAPGAKEKTPDNAWVQTGPHVMIVGAAARPMMNGYPREAEADPNKPFVMWPDTPYEHLMLPVE